MMTSPCVGFGALDVPPLLEVVVPPLLDVDDPPLLDVDVPPLLLVLLDVPPLLEEEVDEPPLLPPLLDDDVDDVDPPSFAGSFVLPPSARVGSPLPSTPGRFGSTSGVTSGISVDAQAATRIVAAAASRRWNCTIGARCYCYALRRAASEPAGGDVQETRLKHLHHTVI